MEAFLKLLRDTSPAFVCKVAGRKEPKPEPVTIRVTHEVGSPTTAQLLSQLSNSATETLIPFYSLHDGASLFIGPVMLFQKAIIPAFRLYSVSEMDTQTMEMRKSAIAMGTPEDDLYDFQKEGIALGEISCSGNYFILHKNQVFYSNHDGGDDDPFAPSFLSFLNRIAANPALFLYEAGCYTRYWDGVTSNQWIPETYLPNA